MELRDICFPDGDAQQIICISKGIALDEIECQESVALQSLESHLCVDSHALTRAMEVIEARPTGFLLQTHYPPGETRGMSVLHAQSNYGIN